LANEIGAAHPRTYTTTKRKLPAFDSYATHAQPAGAQQRAPGYAKADDPTNAAELERAAVHV